MNILCPQPAIGSVHGADMLQHRKTEGRKLLTGKFCVLWEMSSGGKASNNQQPRIYLKGFKVSYEHANVVAL